MPLEKCDADHSEPQTALSCQFISGPSQDYFPIEKKKTKNQKTSPMHKSWQTEHPHTNFRRLSAADKMTPAFLPRVSQIKQQYGRTCRSLFRCSRLTDTENKNPRKLISDFIFIQVWVITVVAVTADWRMSMLNPASELFKDESTVNVRAKKNPEALY